MNSSATSLSPWRLGTQDLYASRPWYYGLLAAGSMSHGLYYCTVSLVGIGVNALWGGGLGGVHWALARRWGQFHLPVAHAPSD